MTPIYFISSFFSLVRLVYSFNANIGVVVFGYHTHIHINLALSVSERIKNNLKRKIGRIMSFIIRSFPENVVWPMKRFWMENRRYTRIYVELIEGSKTFQRAYFREEDEVTWM